MLVIDEVLQIAQEQCENRFSRGDENCGDHAREDAIVKKLKALSDVGVVQIQPLAELIPAADAIGDRLAQFRKVSEILRENCCQHSAESRCAVEKVIQKLASSPGRI